MFKKLLLLLAICLMAAPAIADDEMSLDDVIAKNIEAKGGADAWKMIDTAKVVGRLDMGGGMEAPLTLYFKRPDKVRMEIEMQGNKIVQAYDGQIGWQIMPLMGKLDAQAMNDNEVKQMKRQADFEGPLFDYADKGHTVKLLGKEEIEGTEAYVLELTLDTGEVSQMYLDAEYFLEIKQKGKIENQGVEMATNVTYGDYKEVGDIILAHSVEVKPEGAPAGATLTFDSVELNPKDVNDDFFAMPEAKTEAKAEEAAADN